MRTWEQEKAYREKRAQELGAEMDLAIEAIDKDRFQKAYTTAMNYMTKKTRSAYFKRFVEKYGKEGVKSGKSTDI